MAKITDGIDFSNGDGANTNQDPVWNPNPSDLPNPDEILYQAADNVQPGNIITRIGDEDEVNTVTCDNTKVQISSTNLINIHSSGNAAVSATGGALALEGTNDVDIQSLNDINMTISGGGNLNIIGLPNGVQTNVLYIDPSTNAISSDNVAVPTITLSGDVTGVGAATIITTLSNSAVTSNKIADDSITNSKLSNNAVTTNNIAANTITYSKIQTVGASKILGNPTGGATTLSEIGVDASLAFNGTNLQRAALTGDAAAIAGSNAMSVVGLRGNPITATAMRNLCGYIYLSGSAGFVTADINFLLDQVFSTATAVSSILNTEQTIYTNNFSTSLINLDSTGFRWNFSVNSTNAGTLKFYFSNTVTPLFTLTLPTLVATTQNISIPIEAIRTSSSTAKLKLTTIAGDSQTLTTGPFYSSQFATQTSINWASTLTWKLTGTSTSVINSIVGQDYRVYLN